MNRIYSIQYDLRNPGRNYDKLIAAIKRLCPNWAKPLESCFVIVSSATAAQLRDSLASQLDQNDRLLVLQVGSDWASWNIEAEVNGWFKQQIG